MTMLLLLFTKVMLLIMVLIMVVMIQACLLNLVSGIVNYVNDGDDTLRIT